jgi:hypothetical protein
VSIQIDKRIVACDVVGQNEPQAAEQQDRAPETRAEVIQLHEKIERPELLLGSTYKIKTPLSEHALYVTINDIILNAGTEHELRRPFEIFINSKNMDHFQWIVALTRIISAVFRKGGDVTFMVDELRSVFDPRGGYFKKGGRYMPSLVAEIGDAIESHLRDIGMLEKTESGSNSDGGEDDAYPANALLCMKCLTKAVVSADGCMTCLNCGDSKCG